MGSSKTASNRKPRDQRSSGTRKTGKNNKNDENNKLASRPKPRPLAKKPSVSASDADAAELLMGLGGMARNRNPLDRITDAVLGIAPEEGAALDADQYGDMDKDEQDEANILNVDEDSDSDEEDYTIIYVVPYKNATRELALPSTTSFGTFLTAVSLKMEVSVTHLSALGYIPSYKPKNSKPLPKLLENPEDFERMMEDISEYRKTCLNSKGGKVKPFTISLNDTSEAPVDGRSKSSGKKKDVQPAAPLDAGEQREHQLMAEIEKKHACQDHVGKACYVTSSGEHYQYNNNDLVIWATLARRNLATLDKVPPELKIEDKLDKQRRAKNAVMQTQSNNFNFGGFNGGINGGGPMWPQMQMPPMPWMYGMPPWMMQPPPQAPASAPTPSPPRKRKYPTIAMWLEELDNDEDRGEDRLNYQQYASILNDIGILRLDDLLEVDTAEKLQELTKMNWGTAKRVMKYAQEDSRKIKKARID